MESQKDYTENLRVASFSAYLDSADDNSFLLKLTGAIPDPISPGVTPRLKKSTFVRSKTTAEEGEIGVFGADKYFNMKMDYYQTPKPLIDHNIQTVIEQEKPKLRAAGTPSVTSDATSCNSQTALMPSFSKNPPQVKPKTGHRNSCFAGIFLCNMPCSDKKSVHVGEHVEEYGSMVQRRDVRKDSFCFTNPAAAFDDGTKGSELLIHQVPPDSVVENNFTLGKQQYFQETRNSIEVFGSQKMFTTRKKGDIAASSTTNLERKLAMLTWDAIPKSQNTASPSSTMGRSGMGGLLIDDMHSEGSSDLFEIETGHPFPTVQQLQESTNDQISMYEPSEASIEWSVVTASAAADFDEKRSTIGLGGEVLKPAKTKNLGVVKKKVRTTGAGLLLGCKSQKSISIDETAVRGANEILNAKKRP